MSSTRAATRAPGRNLPILLLVIALSAINVAGSSYYLSPLSARPRHPLHTLLKASGIVGQSAGVLAFLVFVFLWLYPLRKRWRALAFTGGIARWLDVHVTLALGLPLLLTIHAGWRADGLIGIGFGAMLVVCASGVVGRFLYARIPRARNGTELAREDVERESAQLMQAIATALGEPVDTIRRAFVGTERVGGGPILHTVYRLALDDLRRRRRVRALAREWSKRPGVQRDVVMRAAALASRAIALSDRSSMLDATQRVFKLWHVAHLPFAMTALIAVFIHVAVVVAIGATWFW